MKRHLAAATALLVVSTGCFLRDSPQGPARELADLARKGSEATYAAVYRFNFTRQPAPGVSTRLEIVQQPPVTLRKVESKTKKADGKTVGLAYWFVRNTDGDFACNEFPKTGVRCQADPVIRTTFASAKLDVFFDTPRDDGAFSQVAKAARRVRISGHQGTCFEAVPAALPGPTAREGASPDAATASPAAADRFRYELCYAEDGILLRGRRTTLDEGGAADNAESFVEIASLSRVVEPRELRLPGAVVDPEDL